MTEIRQTTIVKSLIVKLLIEYLSGLKNHSGTYELVESTIQILLAAVWVESSNSAEVGETLGISRKRISAAKEKRLLFNSAIDKKMEEYQIEKDDISESDSESGESSGSSEINDYEFHYNSEDDMKSDII